METKTTPVHPLLEGVTPGEYIIDGSSIFVLNEDGTNRISAQVQRGWENQWKDGGSRTTNEEVEAVARLFRAAPSLAAENALLVERLKEAKQLLEWVREYGEGQKDIGMGFPDFLLSRIGPFLTTL